MKKADVMLKGKKVVAAKLLNDFYKKSHKY
jgi:hypothetical protein